ncbi:DUF6412 domain-containing protein [Actinomadura harenae]|uniref:Sensor histidine kinase n=1 Tax=Actinomadura harenae TaxID=2483351 RepID=A0A3M2LTJ8_9ACTN|nr:DUF6412 domain-containing protein [Actinomadura harenae]RMI40809.1 hypothetical protein EBO15_25185 [Actinomadura harenae]
MRRETGTRLPHLLVWLMVVPAVLLAGASGLSGGDLPRLVIVASLAAVAGLVVLAATRAVRSDGGPALGRVRTTLRERTLRTAFLPQRDPDAAGRPRPRAPGRAIRLSH